MKGIVAPAPALVLVALALSGCVSGPEDGAFLEGPVVDPPLLEHNILVLPELPAPANLENVPQFVLRSVGVPASEPTLGVTSKDTVFFVAGTHVMRSSDLGATWTDVGQKAGPATLPPTTLDPMLYVDPVTDRVFVDQLYVGCSFLSYSDDEGGSWMHNPAACGLPGDDHQTLAAGPTSLPAPLYEGRALYYCANQLADSTCAVSLDGGLTFPITRPVFAGDHGVDCGGISGHVKTAPDGTIYLPAWRCDQAWLAISRDDGNTWTARRMSDTSSGPMDPSVAIGRDGSVNYYWMDTEGHPWLMVSPDGGATWGAPIDVAFPGLVVANLPAIVAGDGGRIAMTFIATTQGKAVSPGRVDTTTPWDLYVTLSTDALSPEPHFITVRLNPAGDPIFRGPCSGGYRCGAIVDFMDIQIGPDGRIYVSSVDACGTSDCIGSAPAAGAVADGMGVLGALLGGPSLLKDRQAFVAPVP